MADGEVEDDKEFIDKSDLPPDAKKLFDSIEQMEKVMNKGDGTIPVTSKRGKKVTREIDNSDYASGVSGEKTSQAKQRINDRDDREN